MPFELGLTVMHASNDPSRHTWYAFEARSRRIQKSLSDLSGTDVYIHKGSAKGVMREVGNALVKTNGPAVQQMMRVYRRLLNGLPALLEKTGAQSPFEARVFTELVYIARLDAGKTLP